MLVLNVTYTAKPGQRQAFYDAIKDKAEVFRKEKGNHQYEYFEAKENPDVLFLREQWDDEECLKAHASTDLFASLNAEKDKYVIDVQIDKYQA